MHEANVQRAVKYARRQLGICVLPHELRHGYATHCLERGVNPRAIRAAMGHVSLETTKGYLHAESLSVRSPLEMLEAVASPLDWLNGNLFAKAGGFSTRSTTATVHSLAGTHRFGHEPAEAWQVLSKDGNTSSAPIPESEAAADLARGFWDAPAKTPS
jgi:hypothetical protein